MNCGIGHWSGLQEIESLPNGLLDSLDSLPSPEKDIVIKDKSRQPGAWSNPVIWSGLICVALVTLLVMRQSSSVETCGPGGLGGLASAAEGQPPVLSEVPEFQLINQDSLRFGQDQLRGQIWVANFIFTRCTTICPTLTAKMAEFQKSTESLKRLRLVSFSVDPEHDTPEVLREYAAQHGADTQRWNFLTGPLEALKQAIEKGLRMSMGRDGDVANINEILHGPHFVLVDDRGRIRGYYDVEQAVGFESLLEDTRLLVAEAESARPLSPAKN